MKRLYFEDIEPGMRFESHELTVSGEEVLDFARRYDPQEFHTDPEAAKGTFFRDWVASGWHTSALTMRLVVDSIPIMGGVIGGGVEELRWPNALKPGDTIRIQVEVLEKRVLKSRGDMGLVKVRVVTVNQRGEPVQSMMPNLFAPLRGARVPGKA